LDTIHFGERGLVDRSYMDLDILPQGKFVLAAFDESMAYDPEAETLESYFCLEPGWGEIVMENKAIGIDPETDRPLAAPTKYDFGTIEGDSIIDAFHAQYATDGTLIEQHDVLSTGVVAEGMAILPVSGDVMIVDGNKLHTFDRTGHLLETQTLTGIEDASGIALDTENGRILVADRADQEVRAFDL